jgi:hypothetical protein
LHLYMRAAEGNFPTAPYNRGPAQAHDHHSRERDHASRHEPEYHDRRDHSRDPHEHTRERRCVVRDLRWPICPDVVT